MIVEGRQARPQPAGSRNTVIVSEGDNLALSRAASPALRAAAGPRAGLRDKIAELGRDRLEQRTDAGCSDAVDRTPSGRTVSGDHGQRGACERRSRARAAQANSRQSSLRPAADTLRAWQRSTVCPSAFLPRHGAWHADPPSSTTMTSYWSRARSWQASAARQRLSSFGRLWVGTTTEMRTSHQPDSGFQQERADHQRIQRARSRSTPPHPAARARSARPGY